MNGVAITPCSAMGVSWGGYWGYIRRDHPQSLPVAIGLREASPIPFCHSGFRVCRGVR
jgi:hypothetical protein